MSSNAPHIHVLHVTGLGEGVLGYTSSANEFPRGLYPRTTCFTAVRLAQLTLSTEN